MRTEKILLSIFLIGVVFKLLHWPMAGLLVIIPLSILAMVYYPGGFYFLSVRGSAKQQHLAMSISAGIAFSIAVVGIMFKIQFWPGSALILLVGCAASLLVLVFIQVLKFRSGELLGIYLKRLTFRSLFYIGVTALLYFTPMRTMLSLQYPDDSELVRLMNNAYSNPENETYRQELNDYFEKKQSNALEGDE